MTERPNYCSNCGAPLPAGGNFCVRCGKPVAAPAAPPAYPARPQPYPQTGTVSPTPPPYQQAGPAQPPTYQQPYPQPYAPARRPARRRNWLAVVLLVVGLLLVLALVARFTALRLVGQTTIGTVTSVEETGGEDYEYSIGYSFVTPSGDRVSGAAVQTDVLDISRLPDVGDTVTVRYLSFWPAINELAP